MLDELLLGLQRPSGIGCQSDTFRHAQHVGIDSHGGLTEPYRQHHVGSLAADACQSLQVVQVVGYIAAIHLHYALCHSYQVG